MTGSVKGKHRAYYILVSKESGAKEDYLHLKEE